MNADTFYRQKVKEGIERLQKLQSLNAPDVIMAREILLLHERASVAYGEAFWMELKERYAANILRRNGFCLRCRELSDLVNDEYCSKCSKEVDREYGEDHEMN